MANKELHSKGLGLLYVNQENSGFARFIASILCFFGFPDNDANTEPDNWYKEAESWGFANRLAGELTARTVPLAGIAEMADRVKMNNWEDNLDAVLFEYQSFSIVYFSILYVFLTSNQFMYFGNVFKQVL